MPKRPRFLLDVNVLIALLDEDHIHHPAAIDWFRTPGLQWAICPFSEAGLLRHMTRAKAGNMSIDEVNAILDQLARQPGYRYQPVSEGWRTLCEEFSKRIFGHNQITDAYLLGMAVREDLVLATFDRAILHLAGEYGRHVLILETK